MNLAFSEPVKKTKKTSLVNVFLTSPGDTVRLEKLRCVRLKTDV